MSRPIFHVPFDLHGVPAINNFVGRNDELSQIEKLLISNSRSNRHVVVLQGLGGVGKTQLAIKFAREHQGAFHAIFWLNGKKKDTLIRSLAQLVQRLPLQQPDGSDDDDARDSNALEKRAKRVLDWFSLAGNTKWLLIYDNVDEDPWSDLSEDSYDVEQFFPGADHGSILVTTRLKSLQVLGDAVHVKPLCRDEALQVLSKYVSQKALQNDDNSWRPGKCQYSLRYDTKLRTQLIAAGRNFDSYRKVGSPTPGVGVGRFLYYRDRRISFEIPRFLFDVPGKYPYNGRFSALRISNCCRVFRNILCQD